MQIVRFAFEREKDLWNVWRACNIPSAENEVAALISPEAIKVAKGRSFEDAAFSLDVIYSRKLPAFPVDSFVRGLREAWGAIEQQFVKRLVRVTQRNFPYMELSSYVTIIQRCSYNFDDRLFMVSIRNSLPEALKAISKDLFVFQFQKYYWDDLERQLGEDKAKEVLSSLFVLLNLEFRDLWLVQEKDYLDTELKQFIANEWRKEPDFERLLQKIVAREKDGQMLLS